MTVEFHRKFSKDLSKISKDEVLGKIKDVILQLEGADDLRSLSQIKTLKGGGGFLRIRVGQYRIGLQQTADGGLLLLRVMHRREIYRNFPPK